MIFFTAQSTSHVISADHGTEETARHLDSTKGKQEKSHPVTSRSVWHTESEMLNISSRSECIFQMKCDLEWGVICRIACLPSAITRVSSWSRAHRRHLIKKFPPLFSLHSTHHAKLVGSQCLPGQRERESCEVTWARKDDYFYFHSQSQRVSLSDELLITFFLCNLRIAFSCGIYDMCN